MLCSITPTALNVALSAPILASVDKLFDWRALLDILYG